ncbi:tyrosine-type recombinase/integrase [Algiphilus sp.]|uniref:tyrosine-type recombinase/integrase n=1 Tax=Algiphilus sp. TaxID=1872431 RepID=UPI0025B9FEA6|nr:tyrosine-type recombinase/integrase [Algiphilus sp.]MCK5771169.1 site-specific integrase [Algiphilus sp.]
MPAIIWSDGEPWLPAMAYLRERAFEAHATRGSTKTVMLHANALAGYASWLEREELDWSHFPNERSLRPTYRYRGHVMDRIHDQTLARSTAANRMSVLRAFYGWATYVGYLHRSAEPYRPRVVAVRYADAIGRERVTNVVSSDLAIRRGKQSRRGVEEGCVPVRMTDRDALLGIAAEYFRLEFLLTLKLGFFSGMRLGTILGLTHTSLRQNFPSHDIPGWFSISVGPEHGIPTKAGATYHPSIPEPLLRELLTYCRSGRRDARAKKAAPQAKDLVLLSNQGAPLSTRSYSHDMTQLRKLASAQGLRLQNFRFHDTRATFGTAFVLASMQAGHTPDQIMPVLMRLMGHTSAASSMLYIDFVEEDERMDAASAAWEEWLGVPEPVA